MRLSGLLVHTQLLSESKDLSRMNIQPGSRIAEYFNHKRKIEMIPKNRKYSLVGGLTNDDMDRMHTAALDIIATVGMKVPHEGILNLIRDTKGVKVNGEVVTFSFDLVEKAISDMQYPDYAVNADYLINGGAYELNIIDIESGSIRQPLTKDLIEMVKLMDSYGMFGSAPVRPSDIKHNELQEIAMYKYCWENSPRIANSIFEANEKSTLRVAEYVYEMSQAAGKQFSLGFWIKSPFRIDFTELDIIYRFLKKGILLWTATMPIAGASAPLYFPGAYVQSMAELFGGLTLLNLINIGESAPVCLIIDSIRAYPFDFKYASFVYGSPEDIIGTLFQIQLNRRYGIPVVAKSLLTSSNAIDVQLSAEMMAHTLTAAFAGARIFTGAGFLAVDEVFAAEKLVIDYEVVQYVKNVVEGFRFSNEQIATGIIKEVGIGGEFLSHETTLRDYREINWMPEVFEHIMLRKWKDIGEPDLRDKCRKIAKERIRAHEYSLPDHVRRELNRIYRRAEKDIFST